MELSVSKILNFSLESPSQIAPKFYSSGDNKGQKILLGLKQIVGRVLSKNLHEEVTQSKLDFTDFYYCGEQ